MILLLGHRREEPEEVDARITVTAGEPGTGHLEWSGTDFLIDHVPPGTLTGLARILAPLRMVAEDAGEGALSATIGLPDILGVADVATLDPEWTWQPRPLRERLRVPIGIGANGHAVMLDLKESAHGGMGPHGLIVGATGSGKSELLRTLVRPHPDPTRRSC